MDHMRTQEISGSASTMKYQSKEKYETLLNQKFHARHVAHFLNDLTNVSMQSGGLRTERRPRRDHGLDS